MTDLSYSTGLVMFHLLEGLMGSEALYEAVGKHYQTHRGAGGSFQDLAGHLRAATTVNLEPFFEEWLASARWQERLASAGSVAAMLASYREELIGE